MTTGPLDRIVLRAQDCDDHAVVCDMCGETLCTAEHGDTLEVLLAVAIDHLKREHHITTVKPTTIQ